MGKIKVVVSGIHYPLSIMRYFISALQARDDIELKTVGPFTGNRIPWAGGMTINSPHVHVPDVPMPEGLIGNVKFPSAMVESQLGWDEVDLWINADSMFCVTRPKIAKNVATLAIDPHVLNYDFQRTQCDKFYSMQKSYSKLGDEILYYAASEEFHYPEDREKIYDICLIGLQYPERTALVNRLRAKGLNVYYGLGIVYDEYRKIYNQSKLAFSISSKDDLIARVFESLAMQVPLITNRVSDLATHFVDGEHLYVFDGLDQAEAQIHMALANYDDALETAHNGYRKIQNNYLYKHRIQQILEDFDLV